MVPQTFLSKRPCTISVVWSARIHNEGYLVQTCDLPSHELLSDQSRTHDGTRGPVQVVFHHSDSATSLRHDAFLSKWEPSFWFQGCRKCTAPSKQIILAGAWSAKVASRHPVYGTTHQVAYRRRSDDLKGHVFSLDGATGTAHELVAVAPKLSKTTHQALDATPGWRRLRQIENAKQLEKCAFAPRLQPTSAQRNVSKKNKMRSYPHACFSVCLVPCLVLRNIWAHESQQG